MSSPLRVLVVDDSAFMRKMVTEILGRDAALHVVGTARDGADALDKFDALLPDVVTLDVEMPVLDGFGTLTEIMRRRPTPVLMLSSQTQAGADATLRCLELGAVDFIGKPSGSVSLDIEKIAGELISKVKAAANARVVVFRLGNAVGAGSPRPSEKTPAEKMPGEKSSAVLVIGASTGGPRALQTLVPALPPDLNIPMVIVQHMPPGFTASLARRLDQTSPFDVREAAEGDRLQPGQILVAPGGSHLQFDAGGKAHLTSDPPVHGVRPAIDVTLSSLAPLYGPRLMAALLTGMGRDGARGLKLVSDLGGRTLAEDETTCVVYGMPKAAVELGAVDCLLPLHEIAPAIARLCAGKLKREPR